MILIVLLAVQDPQDRQEEVDDIQVKRDGGSDLLLNVIMTHHKLSVDEYIAAEDERCASTIDQFACLAIWEERPNESEQDQDPESTEQIWHPAREVVLGLTGEYRQGEENTRGQDEGK